MMSIWLTAALGIAAPPPVDFATDVVPVLSKAGCNAGACHGSATGRGGLKLSLFGADPAADHSALVHELEGRRVNLAQPGESLILLKATGLLRHGGGPRLDVDGPGSLRIRDWLVAGASLRTPARRLTSLTVTRIVLDGDRSQLQAQARFDDGPAEDVTRWTVFHAADASAVEIDEAGCLTIRRPGRHVVVARFLDRVEPVAVTRPFPKPKAIGAARPAANFIDEEVDRQAAQLHLATAPPADDATFLRRVRLDLTGRLPTPDELHDYVTSRAPDKRSALIDRLLAGDDFVEYWTYRFVRQLGQRSLPGESAGSRTFHAWVREQIRRGRPLDAFARDLITGVGDSHLHGPAWFARLGGDPRGQGELVANALLGVRMQCANCHNHPLDRWTQDDYHGLAAVFARIDRGRIVRVTGRGSVTNPRTGEPAMPRLPGVRDLPTDAEPRVELARWLTEPGQTLFARSTVNRLWHALFGRGLVDPVDDLRESNPATHPELLNRLTADFVEHGFDLRHTLRRIADSHTYAQSATDEPDAGSFTHALRRPLAPEVLVDAWADVLGIPDHYHDELAGTRAIAIRDPGQIRPTLTALGRCNRPAECASGPSAAELPALLHRLNGPPVNAKLADPAGRLMKLLASGQSDAEIATEWTLRALGRRPTDSELRLWCEGGDRTSRLQDMAWAVLNCREFTTNH